MLCFFLARVGQGPGKKYRLAQVKRYFSSESFILDEAFTKSAIFRDGLRRPSAEINGRVVKTQAGNMVGVRGMPEWDIESLGVIWDGGWTRPGDFSVVAVAVRRRPPYFVSLHYKSSYIV